MAHYKDLNVSKPLTNKAVAIMQELNPSDATRFFNEIRVNTITGSYWEWAKGDFKRTEAARKAYGAPVAMRDFGLTTKAYNIPDELAVGTQLPYIELNEAAVHYGTEQEYKMSFLDGLIRDVKIKDNYEFASSYFKTGVWTTTYSGVASSPSATQFIQWSDASSSPISDVRKMKRAIHELTGYMPNVGVISPKIVDALVDHADFYNLMPTTVERLVEVDLIRRAFGLEELIVADLLINTAVEGDTEASSYIFTDNFLIGYRPKAVNKNLAACGYRFAYDQLQRRVGSAEARDFRGVFVKEIDKQADEVVELKVIMPHKDHIIAADLGGIFLNVLA